MGVVKKKVSEMPLVGSIDNFEVFGVNKATNSSARANMTQLRGNVGPKGDPGQGLNVMGRYATAAELKSAYPAGADGFFEVGTGSPFNYYYWDNVGGAWVNSGQLQGAPGKSAYQAAQDGGFIGTEAEFNGSLINATLIETGGDGSEFLGNDGEYHAVGGGSGDTAKRLVNAVTISNISAGAAGWPGNLPEVPAMEVGDVIPVIVPYDTPGNPYGETSADYVLTGTLQRLQGGAGQVDVYRYLLRTAYPSYASVEVVLYESATGTRSRVVNFAVHGSNTGVAMNATSAGSAGSATNAGQLTGSSISDLNTYVPSPSTGAFFGVYCPSSAQNSPFPNEKLSGFVSRFGTLIYPFTYNMVLFSEAQNKIALRKYTRTSASTGTWGGWTILDLDALAGLEVRIAALEAAL